MAVTRTLEAGKQQPYLDLDKVANQIHGSVLVGDYWWGSTRPKIDILGVDGSVVVRLNTLTFEYDHIQPVHSEVGTGSSFNDATYDGTNVWVVGTNIIYKFNPNDINDYEAYRVGCSGEVISTDTTHVYVANSYFIYKFLKSGLNTVGVNGPTGSVNLFTYTHDGNIFPHSMFIDSETNYLWINESSESNGADLNQHYLIGIDLSVFTTVGLKTVDIPKSTDDMCFDGITCWFCGSVPTVKRRQSSKSSPL